MITIGNARHLEWNGLTQQSDEGFEIFFEEAKSEMNLNRTKAVFTREGFLLFEQFFLWIKSF